MGVSDQILVLISNACQCETVLRTMIGRSCWNCRQATENGQLEPSSRMYSWWIRLGSNHAKLVTRGCADIRHSGEMISLPLVRLRDEAPCHIS